MIPKLNPRGRSFHGACSYVLHDVGQANTHDRVAWTMTVNLSTQDVKWAWHEMTETFWAQDALKAASNVKRTGRKNTTPVLHYTLSWAPDEKPDPETMRKAALTSLAALGLSEHEALIAAHNDTKHTHLHIIVNTVHPQTGRTAALSLSKLALSRWAEAYEREHGIQCEQRLTNNAERAKEARARGASALLMDAAAGGKEKPPLTAGHAREAAERAAREEARRRREEWLRKRAISKLGPEGLLTDGPGTSLGPGGTPAIQGWAHRRQGYLSPSAVLERARHGTRAPADVPSPRKPMTPERYRAMYPDRDKRNPVFMLAQVRRFPEAGVPRVKHRAPTRKQWIDRQPVLDRMQRMRAEQEVFHKIDRNTSWQRHRQERQELWHSTKGAIGQAQAYVSKKFRPHWREIYKAQDDESRFIARATPLERAVFVFMHRHRLGNGKPLAKREMHRAIAKPGRLLDLLEAAHQRERTALAQIQKVEAHQHIGKILDGYAVKHNALLSRQSDERQEQRLDQFKETRKVTFKDARDSLIDEGWEPPPKPPFKRHEPEQFEDRAEDIRREMEAWRKKNKGRDFGREM